MSQTSGQGAAAQTAFVLPPLPYAFDALEPYIDAKTMEIHHDKHHGAYVTNLNKALEGHADLQKLSIEELLAQLTGQPQKIEVVVRDHGPGIPPDQLERVFEPFYRLEHSRNRDSGGTGLGLSIARDLAQVHGGTLTLANLPAGGLEATLRLPRRP